MRWEEIRKLYPDQYVKLQILAAHTEGNTKFVDEVALIRSIQDPKEATKELLQSKDGVIVSHTANEELMVDIRTIRGLRLKMASLFFKDENVLQQLQQAKENRQNGINNYSDDEEAFAQQIPEGKDYNKLKDSPSSFSS